MSLTEEQKERIKRNRERALEIRRRKLAEQQEKAAAAAEQQRNQKEIQQQSLGAVKHENKDGTVEMEKKIEGNKEENKNPYINMMNQTTQNNTKYNNNNQQKEEQEETEEEEIELEEFEIGASTQITKTEAMKLYCLPIGTLNICSYITKPNPRQSKWKEMKLYNRNEIRRRARERFGGLDGLKEERRRREMKRFERDLDVVDGVFGNSSTSSMSSSSNKKRKR